MVREVESAQTPANRQCSPPTLTTLAGANGKNLITLCLISGCDSLRYQKCKVLPFLHFSLKSGREGYSHATNRNPDLMTQRYKITANLPNLLLKIFLKSLYKFHKLQFIKRNCVFFLRFCEIYNTL